MISLVAFDMGQPGVGEFEEQVPLGEMPNQLCKCFPLARLRQIRVDQHEYAAQDDFLLGQRYRLVALEQRLPQDRQIRLIHFREQCQIISLALQAGIGFPFQLFCFSCPLVPLDQIVQVF